MLEPIKVVRVGQIQPKDTLVVEDKRGEKFIATAREVISPGSGDEEIVLSTTTNVYFLMEKYLAGTSWVRNVYILPGVVVTAMTNTNVKFNRY